MRALGQKRQSEEGMDQMHKREIEIVNERHQREQAHLVGLNLKFIKGSGEVKVFDQCRAFFDSGFVLSLKSRVSLVANGSRHGRDS